MMKDSVKGFYNKQNLQLLLLGMLLTLSAGLLLWYFSHEINQHQYRSAEQEAKVFAETLVEFRNYYSQNIIPRARQNEIPITHHYRDTENALPLPATFLIGLTEELTDLNTGYSSSLFSRHPFPSREKRQLDSFQIKAIEALNANPEVPFMAVETIEGQVFMRYALADRMLESCVSCHNMHPESPKNDWQVGDVRGVLEVKKIINDQYLGISAGFRNATYASALMIIALLAIMWMAMSGMRRAMALANRKNYELLDLQRRLEQQIFALDQHAIVSTTDSQGRIISANEKFCEISGYQLTELIGKNHRIVNSNLHDAEFFENLWNMITQGKVWAGEIRNQRKDGSYYWVSATIVPIMDNSGRIQRYIGIRTDISERKASEMELMQAKEAAEVANKTKSDFLANMSHEIRTPMNGIIGMSTLALETHHEEERREYLKIVKSSAEALLSIINDILDFSKIEANKLLLESIGFDLRRTFSETLKTLNVRALEKGLEIICDIDEKVPVNLVGDPTRVRQVLLNLVGNAIKFTKEGEIVVSVDLEDKHDDSVILLVSVRDTGIGIPEQKMHSIFEAFSQVDSSTTREFGGTGLGLSISARLVELMGGKINAVSETGKGSTFQFTLDLEVDPTPVEPIRTDQLNGKIVFIVDDNAFNRDILHHQVKRWGMISHKVSSGVEAQTKLSNEGILPDLFILDQHMPQMDGLSLAAWIRDFSTYRQIPILILSSGPLSTDSDKVKNLKLQGVLTKPIIDLDLLDAVKRALGFQNVHLNVELEQDKENVLLTEKPIALKVLLVEDNLVNQKLAKVMLSKRGCDVDIANNGKEGFDKLCHNTISQSYDIVFMDMQMPVMGGIEATKLIRQYEQEHNLAQTIIIAMTANAMQSDKEACLAAGMNDYLSKPINHVQLSEILKKYNN